MNRLAVLMRNKYSNIRQKEYMTVHFVLCPDLEFTIYA